MVTEMHLTTYSWLLAVFAEKFGIFIKENELLIVLSGYLINYSLIEN
jgi:hypothetical protein